MKDYLSSEQMDDLKRVLDDSHSHDLLTIVTTMHHERAGETLHNGALSLAETFHLVATSGVREKFGKFLLHSNVILQNGTHGYIPDFKIAIQKGLNYSSKDES